MRTKNSFKNVVSVVLLNLIIGILGFIKVRVFVNSLSNDIYSLNQLFYQIFSYIIVADLGFGLILNKKLYEAFSKKDYKEINKIYSTSKQFYKTIGIIMIMIALFISFFVHFLTKADVSNGYIQLIFIIFIIKNVVDYFFIAPRFIIEADQKNYKINHLIKGIKIVEIIIEIILALYGVNYLIILIPGIILTIAMDIYVNNLVFKEYPWLENNRSFDKKYLKGTEDLIPVKIAGIMNSNTDIILISTFINPLSVIIYTSYNYITKFVTDTLYIVASAIIPSYANVICKDTEEKSFSVFKELNILFLFIASFVSVMLYGFLNNLIELWVGKEYLVNKYILLLFCIITFQNIASRAIVMTINSKGLFKETKTATILEAILNLILSIALIQKFGLAGVLLGTIISFFVTSFFQNSYYIYKNVFRQKYGSYLISYFVICLLTTSLLLTINIIPINIDGITSFIVYVLFSALLIGMILLIIFSIFFKSFREILVRGINLFNHPKATD